MKNLQEVNKNLEYFERLLKGALLANSLVIILQGFLILLLLIE